MMRGPVLSCLITGCQCEPGSPRADTITTGGSRPSRISAAIKAALIDLQPSDFQRSETKSTGTASVAAGACWPDHPNGDCILAGAGDHVGGSAIAACWLAVPDGPKLVSVPEHELARCHMRFGCGFGEIQSVHRVCAGKQPVIFRPGPGRQALLVSGGRNHCLNAAAEIQECARHNLVGPISEQGQPDHICGLPGQCRPDRLTDQAFRIR